VSEAQNPRPTGYALAARVPAFGVLDRRAARVLAPVMRPLLMLTLTAALLAFAPQATPGGTPTCGGRGATILGTPGNDTIHGTGPWT